MSDFERGPLPDFEVVWTSGHIETVRAHQVLTPQPPSIFGTDARGQRWTFHGEIDGHWGLILTAPEEDIRAVRCVTHTQADGWST